MQLAKSRLAVLAGLPLIVLALALDTGFILVWRLFVVLAVVTAVSLAWVLLVGVRGVRGHLSPAPLHIQVGDLFERTLTLTNTGRLPRPLLRVHEENECAGARQAHLLALPPRSVRQVLVHTRCSQRGRYRLGSFTMRGSDPLGLLSRHIVVGQPEERLVCPATLELPYFELARRRRRSSTSNTLAPGISVAGVRDYMEGDSLSRVHWPSTARVGKLQVKLFDHDPSPRALGEVWVVLDMRTRIGGGESQASEFCVTVAASLLKRCMDLQFPTGLVVAENGNVAIQPGEGRDHRWRLLEALAVVRSGDGPFLHEILSRDSERFSADSVVLTVTPVADRHLVVPLCRLAGRVGLVMAIVVGLPPGGGDRSPVRRALASAGVEVFTVRDGHDVAASLANSGFMGVGTGGVRSGATPGSVRPVG